jgi:hypothetical protein
VFTGPKLGGAANFLQPDPRIEQHGESERLQDSSVGAARMTSRVHGAYHDLKEIYYAEQCGREDTVRSEYLYARMPDFWELERARSPF